MVQHRRLRVASRQWAVAVISGRRTGAGRSANREGAIGTTPAVEITPEEQERVAREISMQRGYAFV